MDDLQRLEDWVAPLLARLSAPERRALARTVARELRKSNAASMRDQQAPDGTAWTPRKNKLRDQRGAIRAKAKAQAMFVKMRAAKYLQARGTPDEAVVQFAGRADRIARVHHFGLRDRVKSGGPEYDYPARPLLGITEEQLVRIRDLLLSGLKL